MMSNYPGISSHDAAAPKPMQEADEEEMQSQKPCFPARIEILMIINVGNPNAINLPFAGWLTSRLQHHHQNADDWGIWGIGS